jgi:hypothetical protein
MLHLTNEENECPTPPGSRGWIESGNASDRKSMATACGSDVTRTPIGKGDGDGDVVQLTTHLRCTRRLLIRCYAVSAYTMGRAFAPAWASCHLSTR